MIIWQSSLDGKILFWISCTCSLGNSYSEGFNVRYVSFRPKDDLQDHRFPLAPVWGHGDFQRWWGIQCRRDDSLRRHWGTNCQHVSSSSWVMCAHSTPSDMPPSRRACRPPQQNPKTPKTSGSACVRSATFSPRPTYLHAWLFVFQLSQYLPQELVHLAIFMPT